MELLYVDESGDDGLVERSSDFYILSGIAVNDYHWKETFWKLMQFRQELLRRYGLRVDEIKGEDIFQHEGPLFNSGLFPRDQLWICQRLINLVCDELKIALHIQAKSKEKFLLRHKTTSGNLTRIFRQETWEGYLAQYEKELFKKSKRTGYPQNAMIFYDRNQEKHLRSLIRKFTRKFNEQSSFPGTGFIEDVIFYDSKSSLFIQLADFIASVSLRFVKGKSKKDAIEIPTHLRDKFRFKSKSLELQ